MSTVGLVSYVGRFGSHVVDSHELALLLSLLRKSSKIVDYPLINAVASGYYWNLFLDAFLTFHHFLSNVDWLQSLKQFFINVSYYILVASLTLMALF